MKAPAFSVGVEIEVEHAEDMVVPSSIYDKITIKGDGSLRNYGLEYVTTPVPIKDAAHIIHTIVNAGNAAGAVASRRTGLHVHVGSAGLTPFARQRLFVCGLVADAYGQAFWPSRVGNTYCDPLRFQQHAERMATSAKARNPRDHFNISSRYSPINVAAYSRHGTLEFRRGAMYDTYDADNEENMPLAHEKQIAYTALVAASRQLAVDRLARKYLNNSYEAVLHQKLNENEAMMRELAQGVANVAADMIEEYPDSAALIGDTDIMIRYA